MTSKSQVQDDKAVPAGPLAGLRVIEMASIGPGPFAAMCLSDLGADVVRVVRPDNVDDPRDSVLRGRRTLVLDLRECGAKGTLLALLEKADLVLDGYRPGVMERHGLGPDDVCPGNIRLIYARITGWGQNGPLSQRAGHDINYIALTGALAAIGNADANPVPPLNLVGDYGGGALFLLVGILAALHERHRSGRGQVVDAAMVDGATTLMSALYAWKSMDMWPGGRGENLLDGGAPFYGTYQCADDQYIAVGCMEHKFFDVMLQRMGLDRADFAGRDDRTQWPLLRARLADAFRQRTRTEWCAVLEDSDACCTPVLTMDEAAQHPHVAAREIFVDWNGQSIPGPAPRLSRTPGSVRPYSDALPEDAAAILRGWDGL